MDVRIITISREFGSGGRTIGKKLAERLGVPYYDKELVKEVALETGFDPRYIEEAGEHAPIGGRLAYAFNMQGVPGIMRGLSATDFLWCIQREVILRIADKGPCVIVGRSADYILKDRKDALHVFVHADMDFRAERIVRLYGQSEKTPEQRLRDKDKKRAVNYEHYTGREWGKSQNYTLTLNSGAIGVERCVDLLADLVGPIKAETPAPETAQ